MIRRLFKLILAVCITSSALHAMVMDNQWWPLYRQPFFQLQPVTFNYAFRALWLGSDHSFAQSVEESLFDGDDLPLFRIFGTYDEAQIDKALQAAGITTESLLRSDMRSISSIPWRMDGKIALRGGVFEAFLALGCHAGFGASIFLGKVRSQLELDPSCGKLFTLGNEAELILSNKRIHELLGLKPPCYDDFACGDINLYFRLRALRDYWHKIRHLDVGLNFGLLIPTAKGNDPFNPAWIPVGGNKHFGLYGEFESTFVLKEDLAFGLWLHVSKRLARTSMQRMPYQVEPTNYGVLVHPARVTPGWTIFFQPWVQALELRQGLGVKVGYVLTHHTQDCWQDLSTSTVKGNTKLLQERSEWGSDYFTVSAFYDFGYDKEGPTCAPILSLTIDVPFNGLVTKRVSKTHGISLRIESAL